jgi:histone acetyltransferase (RNA polymerase elongator complex component)
MIDEVLILARRGHGREDTLSATFRLRRWDFEVGIHLMSGLPGDTCDRFLQSLDQVIDLKPDFLRIHPTLVLRGAPLEILWETGRYVPLSLQETIHWLKKGLLTLQRSRIRVARIGLQPTQGLEKHLLAGPYHPALHQLVDSEIAFDMAEHLLRNHSGESQARFLCHPKEVSTLRGQRNGNIPRLKEQFQLKEVFIQGVEEIPRGSLFLHTPTGYASIKRKDLVC